MKLNFWQWLAVALLIIGSGLWIYEWSHKPQNPPPDPEHMPTTQNMKAA